MKPAFKQGVTWDDYCSIRKLNASSAVHGLKSMFALWRAQKEKQAPTKAMEFGSRFHQLVLEEQEFHQSHVMAPDFANHTDNVDAGGNPSKSGNTKWAKTQKARFKETNLRTVVDRSDWWTMSEMVKGIARNACASDILKECEREVTLEGDFDGVPVKGRLDLVAKTYWADIKTTQSAAAEPFGNSMARFNTAFKMAWYRRLLRQAGAHGAAEQALLIAVEKDGDFDCCVYEIPTPALDAADDQIDDVIRRYKSAKQTDTWPGVQAGFPTPRPLFIPNWAMPEEQFNWEDVNYA